jgi:hypothetical protein
MALFCPGSYAVYRDVLKNASEGDQAARAII